MDLGLVQKFLKCCWINFSFFWWRGSGCGHWGEWKESLLFFQRENRSFKSYFCSDNGHNHTSRGWHCFDMLTHSFYLNGTVPGLLCAAPCSLRRAPWVWAAWSQISRRRSDRPAPTQPLCSSTRVCRTRHTSTPAGQSLVLQLHGHNWKGEGNVLLILLSCILFFFYYSEFGFGWIT